MTHCYANMAGMALLSSACHHLVHAAHGMSMVQSLSRRGLHATALEVAKLSLVLDWRDPMDLTQVIDYYALRCRNYSFVEVRSPWQDHGLV